MYPKNISCAEFLFAPMEYFWAYLELKSCRGYSIDNISRETTNLISDSPKYFLKFAENNQYYQYETSDFSYHSF